MSTQAKSALVVSNWEETALTSVEGGPAMARATSDAVFTGDLNGKGTSTWLLVYPPEGVASFVGTQTFEGTVAGRAGAFVLQMAGTWDGAGAHVTWSVMPDSAGGDLRGIRGTGGYQSAADAPSAETLLDYELD
jgi:hypothetical protein